MKTYTILQQQKCGSTTCLNNEKKLLDKGIHITSHFSEIKEIFKKYNFKNENHFKNSVPYKINYSMLNIPKNNKVIAIIRDPVNLLLSHYNQEKTGCMDIRHQFKTLDDFLNNVKLNKIFHPTLISTHYPLFDNNFKMQKIDFLLHLQNLDKFLLENDINIKEKHKEIKNNIKINQKSRLTKEIENLNQYYCLENNLSNLVKTKILFNVKDLPAEYTEIPKKRIEKLIKIFGK